MRWEIPAGGDVLNLRIPARCEGGAAQPMDEARPGAEEVPVD